jgi:hypothetical protein
VLLLLPPPPWNSDVLTTLLPGDVPATAADVAAATALKGELKDFKGELNRLMKAAALDKALRL